MPELTETRKRHLRRLGHNLKPVVRTGNQGLTDAVMAELERALRDHELVKARLVADDRAERQRFIERIRAETRATVVQAVGHVVLLYRPNPEKKKGRIELP